MPTYAFSDLAYAGYEQESSLMVYLGTGRWVPPAARALALLGAIAAGGCDDSAQSDAGTDPPGPCLRNVDCDDELFCNGAEHCVDGMCELGASPCEIGLSCDETSDRCVEDCAVPDADGDGVARTQCGGDDCDDEDALRFPGSAEVCDAENRDEDCEPMTFGERDRDGDGHVDAACCNGGRCGEDCDDTRRGVSPEAAEVCNGADDDCDGIIDESGTPIDWYADADGDGFGARDAETMTSCATPGAAWSRFDTDCDDMRRDVSPVAREVPNDRDDDCDGRVDEPPMDVTGGGIRALGSLPSSGVRYVVEDRMEAVSTACPAGRRRCVTGGILP
jgi:hypothetical protein